MISVVVPNYNHSQYLQQRIESVLGQTYEDIEVIILDDSSSDGSRSVIESLRGHPKISVIDYNKKNSGNPFKQWQKGINLSRGEYVWIAESDDWAEADFLSKTHKKMVGDRSIGLTYCDASVYKDDRLTTSFSEIKGKMLHTDKWELDYVVDGMKEVLDYLVFFCSINNASSVLFRKDTLLQARPFELGLKYIGDWYCYLKVASISKVAYISERLNNYRDHSGNLSKTMHKNDSQLLEYFLLYDWILRNLNLNNKRKALEYFDGYTSHSVNILNPASLFHYRELYNKNRSLFLHMVSATLRREVKPLLTKFATGFARHTL